MKNAKRIWSVLVLMACMLFVSGTAQAATHIVPGTYSTIQEAINAAVDGDTISVRPGIYYENVVLRSRSLTLRSMNGPGQTIIDGGKAGPVIFIGSGGTSTIDGFTIQNGLASGVYAGGIAIYYETPGSATNTNINNCIITNNTGGSGGGVGSYCVPNPVSTIGVMLTNSSIVNNTATQGGGIFSLGYGGVRVQNCTIANNKATTNGGGIAVEYLSNSYVTNSFISGNNADGNGGGVSVHTIWSSLTINNSVVDLNTAGVAGGGIVAGYGGNLYPLVLNNNTITRNTAPEGGGIMEEVGRALTGSNNIIYGNSTLPSFRDVASMQLQYSDIEGGSMGTGNIDVDPLFLNAAARNYQLNVASPAIDSGTTVYGYDTYNDMFGLSRPQGMGLDMGAYEYMPPDTIAPVSVAAATGTTGTNGWYTSDVTVAIDATDTNGVKEIHCIINGVETIVAGSNASIPLTSDGTYAISFYAVDNAGNIETSAHLLSINIDKTAPMVSSTVPTNSATGVLRASSIVVTFSENVTAGSAFANITLKRGSTTITTTKTLAGNTLTIKPTSSMNSTTTYTVTIPANAVVDSAGNNIGAAYTFTFRTGAN